MRSNTTRQRVPTRFARQTRFALKPKLVPADAHRTRDAFHQLKRKLVEPALEDAADPVLRRQLSLAANEAAAVAWTTPFPLLAFPVLLEEKTAAAHEYAVRQEAVEEATHLLLEASW